MTEAARMLVKHGPWPTPAAAELLTARYAGPSAEPSAKLRQVLRAFSRRRRVIVLTLVALNAVAFIGLKAITPRYTAEATVLIGPRQEQVLDLKSVLAGLSGDSEAIESEVQVMRSHKISRAVVQELHLDNDADFVSPASRPGLLQAVLGVARMRWNLLTGRFHPAWQLPLPAAQADATHTRDPVAQATESLVRHLGVTPRGHSRVISVTFDSTSPELAAAVANGIANTYIADQLRAKRDATASAHRWLEDRVGEMRQQVINADQQVADYRHRATLTQGKTGNLLSEQISTLGEQAVEAQVARDNAQARLRALQAAGGSGRLDSLPETQASPTIQALQSQQSTLQAQVAELSRSLGDNHPRVVAARAAAGAVAARMAAETSKVGLALQDQARTAQAREASLSRSLASLRQQVDTGAASEVELHALQHEAEANRALYDRLLARSLETNVEGGLQQPDAQVISYADSPEVASFPNPAVILPIFFVASCIATVLLVFALEAISGGFMTLEQVEQVIGMPALGLLPRLKGGARRAITAVSANGLSGSGAASAYCEAVRSLHTSLMLSSPSGERPKVVLVTSALPSEGRSSVVLSLARLMASCGKRVVVVDCDLHRPDLHRACDVAIGPGLVECLTEGTSVHSVLQGDRASPAYVIAAGSKGATPPDMFASDAMRQLVAELTGRFDLVLLDSSPILAVSDTRNLCRIADTTVFVVRWRDTRRVAAIAGLRHVLESGGRFAGVLLSNVDLKRYARHSHAGVYQRRIGLYLSE